MRAQFSHLGLLVSLVVAMPEAGAQQQPDKPAPHVPLYSQLMSSRPTPSPEDQHAQDQSISKMKDALSNFQTAGGIAPTENVPAPTNTATPPAPGSPLPSAFVPVAGASRGIASQPAYDPNAQIQMTPEQQAAYDQLQKNMKEMSEKLKNLVPESK